MKPKLDKLMFVSSSTILTIVLIVSKETLSDLKENLNILSQSKLFTIFTLMCAAILIFYLLSGIIQTIIDYAIEYNAYVMYKSRVQLVIKEDLSRLDSFDVKLRGSEKND